MAWKARVTRIIPGDTALRAIVEVGFYESTDPLNLPTPTVFLHRKAYSSDELTTVPALVALVEAEGQAARTAFNRVVAVKAALPIGAEVPIP